MTHSEKQFGRVVNTASAAGLYGNMGQANYSAAKSRYLSVSVNLFLITITIVGLIGFTRTLAREGTKYDIKANVIAPVSNHQTLYYTLLIFPKMAASAMTETIMPPEMLKGLKPEFIAPLVGILTARNVRQVDPY